jgi:hypothetical protein
MALSKGTWNAVPKEQVPARVEVALLNKVRAEARRAKRTLGAELSLMIEEALAVRAQDKPTRERVA